MICTRHVVATLVVTSLMLASGPTVHAGTRSSVQQSPEQEEIVAKQRAEFVESSGDVIDAITSVLVDRSELRPGAVAKMKSAAAGGVGDADGGTITADSVNVDPDRLRELVPEQYRRFISGEGGRYVLRINVVESDSDGTRVQIQPLLVATVSESDSPLGGRVLPTNGELEAAVLAAVRQKLADNR